MRSKSQGSQRARIGEEKPSLATGILEGAGCANAVVVDGGMEAWQAQGLPIVRKKWFPKIAIDAPMLALVAGFGFGLGLAIHEVFFVLPLIVGFAALSPRTHSFFQRQMRRGHSGDLRKPVREKIGRFHTFPAWQLILIVLRISSYIRTAESPSPSVTEGREDSAY